MHQQPLLAPHLPNRSSSAGHRSGVSASIASLVPALVVAISKALISRRMDQARRSDRNMAALAGIAELPWARKMLIGVQTGAAARKEVGATYAHLSQMWRPLAAENTRLG